MKPLILLLCALLSFAAYADTPSTETGTAKRQIEEVIDTFRAAIINRDKDRFNKLFLHEHTVWQNVMSDEGLQRIRQKNPQAVKVRVNPERTYRSFIEGIVSNEARSEEKFRNVRIDTDGDIASVYFDYSFHAGDRETNYGHEAWHLVNTDEGWKIVSVIWSVIPVVPPEKKS
ncbi:MAG TPA: nuclear transport factor 2 family protein [Lysobacter sp.]|nr:nuclear transport factor 2 family protein [Lysobacter sp.]